MRLRVVVWLSAERPELPEILVLFSLVYPDNLFISAFLILLQYVDVFQSHIRVYFLPDIPAILTNPQIKLVYGLNDKDSSLVKSVRHRLCVKYIFQQHSGHNKLRLLNLVA